MWLAVDYVTEILLKMIKSFNTLQKQTSGPGKRFAIFCLSTLSRAEDFAIWLRVPGGGRVMYIICINQF